MEQFENHHNFNIHSSCRTCLDDIKHLETHNIFTIPDLGKKFIACTSLPLEPNDGFPTSLCELCHKKINDFYNFQQTCISSKKRFQDYINSKKNQHPESVDEQNNPLEEQEENSSSNDEFLELDDTNVNIKVESSSESAALDSDDDQPIVQYLATKKKNSPVDSEININKLTCENDNNKMINSKLECKVCKKGFNKIETLKAHLRIHKEVKPFPCQQCDKSYARPGRLKVHIELKHADNPEKFKCIEPDCNKILSSKQTLRQHIAGVHCDSDGSNNIKTKEMYVCEECGIVLKSLGTLKNHRFLHSGKPRPHGCPQCHKRYMTKCKLKDHMNRHAGIKNFVCPYCGAKKSSKSELKNHVNYHTKEKTYPCHICNMVFNNIVNFRRHRRVVHEGIKNFPCSYCDKSFGKAETRKHHEMIHTGEKPHECNICHKKFIQIVSLKKHQKVHLKALGNGEV